MSFLEDERLAGRPVSNRLLQSHALQLAAKMGRRRLSSIAPVPDSLEEALQCVVAGEDKRKPELAHQSDTEVTATFSEAVSVLRLENGHTHYSVECLDLIVVCVDCPAARMDDAACGSIVQMANIGCALRQVTMALLQRQDSTNFTIQY
uniref:Uncharacterized protein n=1 Tax=Ixodes ricinus TaxID=34613 RepID=A0A0K8R9T2_IXORI